MKPKTVFAMFLTLIFFALFLGWAGTRIYQSVDFNRQIGGHLQRASNANTVEIAQEELKISIIEIERQRLTEGYTSILWKSPREDVGFWYQNIKAAYNELSTVSDDASQLEKTNILMKLRESLKNEDGIIVPGGISVFPSNTGFAVWGWSSIILTILFAIWFFYRFDND